MTPTTTPTINGLRLVSPADVGYREESYSGKFQIHTVLLENDKPIRAFAVDGVVLFPEQLVPIPKPRTTRPYKRGEVRLGWMFRHKESQCDHAVVGIDDDGPTVGNYGSTTFQNLYEKFQRLTYDSEGREVLECAGVEE